MDHKYDDIKMDEIIEITVANVSKYETEKSYVSKYREIITSNESSFKDQLIGTPDNYYSFLFLSLKPLFKYSIVAAM